jgi:hypothetical protein
MIRRFEFRFVIAAVLALAGTRRVEAQANGLKLVLTLESPAVTYPFPVRATLHLVNGGTKPVWLYHRARNSTEILPTSSQPGAFILENPAEGPTLAVHLVDAAPGVPERGEGAVLEPTGLPHPELVRLGPGEEYAEKEVIQLSPATPRARGEDSKSPPIWGRYRLSVTYRAKHSNADEVARLTGVELWQGDIASDPIEVELAPPAGTGSITGSVLAPDNQRITDALASITDEEERLIGQVRVDLDGRFAFSNLSLGIYWVVVERTPRKEQTAVFRRFKLTAESPATSFDFVLSPVEIHHPKQLLHEPVVFQVTSPAGSPVAATSVEATWSSGDVMDSVKGKTDRQGQVVLDLIPGPNIITFKRKGCPEEVQRLVVEGKSVVDGFNLVEECRKP